MKNINSSMFQFWSEWNGSRSKSKSATSKLLKDWGVVQFMVKLHLSPSEDCRRVVVDLLALPVKASTMKNLPSYEIVKSGAGYPAVLVKEGSKYPTRLAPAMADEAKPFGLPSWPLLLMGWEETVFPDQKLIVQAIRAMWHNAILPPVVLAEDWWRMNKEAKVSATAVPCPAEWPVLEVQPQVEVEGTQGKKFLTFYFWALWHYHLVIF